jgi:hypothetical protein
MSAASVHNESPRKEGSVRILIVDASSSCRLTISPADSSSDTAARIEVIKGTQADVDQHSSDAWDLVITHTAEPPTEETLMKPHSGVAELLGGVSRGRPDAEPLRPSWTFFGATSGPSGILRKILRRKRVSVLEPEEHRANRTVVLADIRRELGVALGAIETVDFDAIGEIATRLKDDGAYYNFAKLSGLGAALYDTVPSRDIRTARTIAEKLMTYMSKTIA